MPLLLHARPAAAAPTFTVTPPCVDDGSRTFRLTLNGTGWDPDYELILTFDGVDPQPENGQQETVASGPNGTWRRTISVTFGPAPGDHTVNVTQGNQIPFVPGRRAERATGPDQTGRRVSVYFPIPCSRPSPTPKPTPTKSPTPKPTPTPTPTATTPPAGALLLRVDPPVVRPGEVAAAIGSGFPASAVVVLAWEGLGPAGSVVTSAAGTFRRPLFVFPRDDPGPRVLVASIGTGRARADLLVQLPPFNPPQVGYRG